MFSDEFDWLMPTIFIVIASCFMVLFLGSAFTPDTERTIWLDSIKNQTKLTYDCDMLKQYRLTMYELGGRVDNWLPNKSDKIYMYINDKIDIIGCDK